MLPLLSRYRDLTAPVVRGWVGCVVTVAVFLGAAAIGGHPGVAVAATWVLVTGTYCLANFCCCRETHCVVTGAGWAVLGLLALAVVSIPGGGPGWIRVDVLALPFLAILGAGYCFECLVAARTGRHALGVGGRHA